MRIEVERQLAEAELTGHVSTVLTFSEAWEAYYAIMAPHKKTVSFNNERSAWFCFAKWCEGHGITTIQSVKPADAACYQKFKIDSKCMPLGINTKLRSINVIYNCLAEYDIFTGVNPFGKIKYLKADTKTRFLPWDKVQQLVELSASVGRDIHLFFVLGAYAGLRKAEILRARWEHVDWEQGRLWVDGSKNPASSAYVPLHAALREALEPYRQDSGYIVKPGKEGETTGDRYRTSEWKNMKKVVDLEKAKAEAEGETPVGHITPHQLRHSVATHLLNMGYSIEQIAVFLRHTNDLSTRRYANLKGVQLTIDEF